MSKFVFILGGARSGKSTHAIELAKASGKKVAFVATCICSDDEEMEKRIKLHQRSRPPHWKLVEEGSDISSALVNLKDKYEVVLIDCLGLLISNLMAGDPADEEIEKKMEILVESIQKMNFTTILVSNDVGSGIVPDIPSARRFRDLVGFANQIMARHADEVIFMQAGIPVRIK